VSIAWRGERGRVPIGAVTLALLLAACADSPTVPDPPSYSVEPLHQWAGGTVTMTASGGRFEVGDIIASGGDTILAVDGSAQAVALALPQDADGPVTLSVVRGTAVLGQVLVEAYGVSELRVYPGRMSDMISDLPVPEGVSVVARQYAQGCCGDSEGGFVWIYPSTGMHGTFDGTPDLWDLFRVGVDPQTGDVYYERRWGEAGECSEPNCDMIHRARIVGGDLVDLGWIERPCNRYSCQPLAGDIWIALDGALTCRVVSNPTGDTCEYIDSSLNADDPLGIEYMWSRDLALLLGPARTIRISTGEHAYSLSDWYNSAAVDEARGLFYLSARVLERLDESWQIEIVTVRGDNGSEERAVGLTLTCPRESPLPRSCGEPDLAYDEARDLLYLLRSDTRTLEARDPVTLEVRGRVDLPGEIGSWYIARVLVDHFTENVFVVFAGADTRDPSTRVYGPAAGTPVVAVRLPPM
jgi:hypothetical protein